MEIKGRTKVSSSITFQTLFKYYSKLSGMTVTRTALLLTPSLLKLLKLPHFMRPVMLYSLHLLFSSCSSCLTSCVLLCSTPYTFSSQVAQVASLHACCYALLLTPSLLKLLKLPHFMRAARLYSLHLLFSSCSSCLTSCVLLCSSGRCSPEVPLSDMHGFGHATLHCVSITDGIRNL